MKKWLTMLFTVFASIFIVIGCSDDSTSNGSTGEETEVVEKEVVISISIDEEAEIVTEKVIEIEDGAILMDVMKDNFTIEETDGIIESIEDISPAEGEEKAWVLFVNGELAEVGAEKYELSSGDYVVFDLQARE